VIAVASAKGSPGVSFVAAGLACRFAALGLPVLAVDADAEDPALAVFFDLREPGGEAAQSAASDLPVLTPEALRGMTQAAARNLHLLELASRSAAPLDGRTIVGTAREAEFAAVVIDLGHQHGALQKQLGAAADWLLWVVEPDRVGLDRADRALSAPAVRGASAGLVLNRLGAHTLKGADRELCRRHEMPVMATIREDRRAASRCTAAQPWHRQRRFRAGFDDLAHALHPDLAGNRRGSWP
jgi:MinD superfamily P-loop ATPase